MGIVVGIPYYSNKAGLAYLLGTLQPQMDENDILYIVDDSPDKSGIEIAKMYAGSRTVVLCETTGGKGIYNGWNAILESMLEHKKDGAFILNDDVVLSQTCIANIKRADKMTDDVALITKTPTREWNSKQFDPNFTWFNPAVKKDDIRPAQWLCGFAFYLKRATVEKIGLFNTDFDVWFADTWYEKQVLNLGTIGRLHNEYIYHFGGSSYKYKSPEVQARIDKDRILYDKLLPTLKKA